MTLEPAPPGHARSLYSVVLTETFHTVVSEGSLTPPAGWCVQTALMPATVGGKLCQQEEKENCGDHPKAPHPHPRGLRGSLTMGAPRLARRGDSKTSLCGGNARLPDPDSSVPHNLRCPHGFAGPSVHDGAGFAFFPSLSLPAPTFVLPSVSGFAVGVALGTRGKIFVDRFLAPPLFCLAPLPSPPLPSIPLS